MCIFYYCELSVHLKSTAACHLLIFLDKHLGESEQGLGPWDLKRCYFEHKFWMDYSRLGCHKSAKSKKQKNEGMPFNAYKNDQKIDFAYVLFRLL